MICQNEIHETAVVAMSVAVTPALVTPVDVVIADDAATITILKVITSSNNWNETAPRRGCFYFLSLRLSAWWRGKVIMKVVPLPIALFK